MSSNLPLSSLLTKLYIEVSVIYSCVYPRYFSQAGLIRVTTPSRISISSAGFIFQNAVMSDSSSSRWFESARNSGKRLRFSFLTGRRFSSSMVGMAKL